MVSMNADDVDASGTSARRERELRKADDNVTRREEPTDGFT